MDLPTEEIEMFFSVIPVGSMVRYLTMIGEAVRAEVPKHERGPGQRESRKKLGTGGPEK